MPRRTDMDAEIVALYPVMHRMALKMTSDGSDALDLVQETMSRAIRYSHLFTDMRENGEGLKAWMIVIMRNCHRNNNKKRSPRRNEFSYDPTRLMEIANRSRGCEPSQFHHLRLKEVIKASSAPDGRLLDYVFELDGVEEASERWGVPVGTAKSRVHRARIRLEEMDV